MLFAAVLFSFVACVDRSDPTAPGASNTPSSPVSGNVASVDVKLPATSLEVGQAANAAATAMNRAGQPVQSDTIEWSSSDTSILVVSNAGVLTARRMGSASVWAKVHGVSGKGTLVVTDTMPASIVVSPASAAAAVGATVQLSATVTTHTGRPLPGHAVKWASTDTRYVTVSATGLATGKLKGFAKIVASASKVADTASVNVASSHIAALKVVPHAATVSSGSKVSLTASALDSQGNSLSGRAVSWTTSNSNIATISTAGVVTAFKIGDATLTATSEGVTAASRVHVTTGGVALVTVTPGSIGLVMGATQPLAVTLSDAAGNALPAATMKWSSSNNSIASVSSSGVVTAKRAGSATVYASVNGVSGKAAVAVSAAGIKSIAVSPASFTLATSGTRQLSASLTDASGNAVTGQTVAWSSSNSAVATVSSSGMVTAMHSGNANITAAAGGASANAAVTVSAGTVSAVSVSPGSASLVAGATQQLVANLTDNTGSAVAGQTVTWTSSDASIVSVSSTGLATAAHTGSATVTATAGGVSGQSTVTVAAGALANVTVTPSSGSIQQGKTIQLAASFTDVAGNPVPATSLSWTSSNTADATVTSAGLVTGMSAGTANVTATANGKSKSAAITVTAIAAPTLSSLTLSPGSTTLATGAKQTFTVAGTWSDGSTTAPAVTYTASGGAITSAGVYTAGTTAGTFRVVAQSGSKADSSVVTITAPVVAAPTLSSLTLSPASISLAPAAKQSFTVAAKWSDGSTTAPAVTYTASGGAITSAGVYTAGATAGTFRVVAQSGSKADSSVVTITAPVTATPTLTAVTVSPGSTTLAPKGTAQFKAVVTWSNGTTTTPVVKYAATGGSITSTGMYTAGSTAGTFKVIASDSNKADTSTVSITAPLAQTAGCSNATSVSTVTELTSALSQAVAGECILLAPGTYTLGASLSIARGGTATSPVIVQGAGSSTIIDVNRQTVTLDASYLHLRKLRLTNFPTVGFWLRGVTGDVLDSIEVDHSQQEAIAIKDGSNHNVIENSLIHDTGLSNGQYAEGIYIGNSGESAPLDFGVTDNQILNNHFGPYVRAEAIDAKEGSDRTIIRGNYIDGTGAFYYSGTGTLVAIKSSGVIIDSNYFQQGMNQAVAFEAPVASVMTGNFATNNKIDLRTTGYGFQFQAGTVSPMGAVISCNNVMLSGQLSNRPCTP